MKIAIIGVLLAAALLMPVSARSAETKSAGKAMALSAVIPGSGQMYCGETGRGVAILAGEILLFSQARNPNSDSDTASISAAFGLVVLHLVQIADAKDAAARANAKAGLSGMRTDLSAFARGMEKAKLSLDLDMVGGSAMVRKTWRF